MTNYTMTIQHRRWIVAALLMLLMNQSYFLGGYTSPEDWDSLPSRIIFLLGGLSLSFLIIELLRYFLPPVAVWSKAKQLGFTPLLAVPVLVAKGFALQLLLQG